MADCGKIQVELVKLATGERLLRLIEPQLGLALEKKLDPGKPVAAQKKSLLGLFEITLARAEPAAG